MSEKEKTVAQAAITEAQQKQLDMMESLGQDTPPADTIEFGSAVKGKVVSLSDESVFVDIALRNEAILSKSEVMDDAGVCTVAVGDTLDLFVVSVTDDEVVVSQRMKNGKAGKPLLRDLMAKAVPVEGRVTGMNKGGFNVTILGHRAFCPFSSIDVKFPSEPAKYMGQSLDFIIARIENRGNNIVLSRIALLEVDLQEKMTEIQQAMQSQEPVSGVVTRIAPFGAFVDLGGVEGLIHISELTWDRDEKTEEVVRENDVVAVKVVAIDQKEPLRESRISLSLKRIDTDPWENALSALTVGAMVEGTVTRLVGFGAFIKLLPGVEGLIRTEEMGWTRVRKPSEVVKKGDVVKVRIVSIDGAARKIDCSLKDMADDPWTTIEKLFPIGAKVTGTVADEKEYGFFVDLTSEVTGLLLKKRIGNDVKKGDVKKGASVEVVIDALDMTERRIALSMGTVSSFEESPSQSERSNSSQKYAKMSTQTQNAPSGPTEFGDLLKKALKK